MKLTLLQGGKNPPIYLTPEMELREELSLDFLYDVSKSKKDLDQLMRLLDPSTANKVVRYIKGFNLNK